MPCLDDILKIREHVSYYVAKNFFYYGIINSGKMQIVLGPTRQISGNDQELKEMAFYCDVPPSETDGFVESMKSIVSLPLESVLQILCAVNYAVNAEKLSLKDICVIDYEDDPVFRNLQERSVKEAIDNTAVLHNSYDLEEELVDTIKNGDMNRLAEMFSNAATVHAGTLASGQIRQIKNTFIVSATLFSRAAIQGGLSHEEAFTLSDRYIQQAELLDDMGQLINLQYKMVVDYTERVAKIRLGANPSKFVLDVLKYIQLHICEPVSTAEMAKALYISRGRLSSKFKEQTGETLTEYILKTKTKEAQKYILYSDKTLTAISAHLGFSSQSHFTKVFKKYSGYTPKEYAKKRKS